MRPVLDKASQFSLQRQRNILSSALPKTSQRSRSFTKWIIEAPRRFDILIKNNLPRMPRVGEEQVLVTREKASPRSPNRKLRKNTRETLTTRESDPSENKTDAEEHGKDREGSSASESGLARRHSQATSSSGTLNVSRSLKTGRQAAETTQPDVKLSASSAAYLEYHISQQLRYRKNRIVESLMETILGCIERNLDTLEGGCDVENNTSQSSSSGFRSGSKLSRAAGQKRHHRRDDEEDDRSHDDDEDDSRKNHKKKTKTMSDDGRLKYACPYYKHDPQKFKNHRTCLGPGWTEVHRVKEHLKRSHMLPEYQCHRCLHPFDKEDQLRAHQRKDKPCAVRDAKTARRDLTDGFDRKKWDKLQKRSQKTWAEKWKEWYCILFEVDPSSTDIPSPYHEVPDKNGGGKSALNDRSIQEFYMSRVTPMIRHLVEQEVEKAIMAVEDDIKSNVKDVIRDLPRRIMESIPPPAHLTDEQSIDYLGALENFEFEENEAFDFSEVVDYEPLAVSDSSFSSGWSDPAMPSSATSIQEEVPVSYCLGV